MRDRTSFLHIIIVFITALVIALPVWAEPIDEETEEHDNIVETIILKDGDFEYIANDDDAITVVKYSGETTTPIIPTEIAGKPVTALGDSAFYGNSKIKSYWQLVSVV